MQTALQVVSLMAVAAGINIPLGYFRQGSVKFSLAWFFFVHLSIPLIIYLRIRCGLGWQFIPFTLASAAGGQIVGGKTYRKRKCLG